MLTRRGLLSRAAMTLVMSVVPLVRFVPAARMIEEEVIEWGGRVGYGVGLPHYALAIEWDPDDIEEFQKAFFGTHRD